MTNPNIQLPKRLTTLKRNGRSTRRGINVRIQSRTPEQQTFINQMPNRKRTYWTRNGYSMKLLDEMIERHIKKGGWIDSPQLTHSHKFNKLFRK